MVDSRQSQVLCAQCELNEVCLQYGSLSGAGEGLVEQVPRNAVARGEVLYRQQAPFDRLYAVHEGAFKSLVQLPDGEERITGFHFAGEVIGAEGLSSGEYSRTVVALQPSQACYLSESWLTGEQQRQDPDGRQGLLLALSHQIRNEQWTGMMAAHRSEQRVAQFIGMVSRRLSDHGFGNDADQFRLPMSREDIASYLGLAVETVSRSFQRLKAAGMIEVSGRNVVLLARDRGLL